MDELDVFTVHNLNRELLTENRKLRERCDHLAEENEAQYHAIRMLEATIENAVKLFKDFAANNDAASIGNPVLWNSVLSELTGSDKPDLDDDERKKRD